MFKLAVQSESIFQNKSQSKFASNNYTEMFFASLDAATFIVKAKRRRVQYVL